MLLVSTKTLGIVVIPGADQKDCGLLREGWVPTCKASVALRVFVAFKLIGFIFK